MGKVRPGRTGRFYWLNKEKLKDAIKTILTMLADLYEEAVQEWILERWPEGIEEATKEVEVNEYGEIVSERNDDKGVRLKPHTFYGVLRGGK